MPRRSLPLTEFLPASAAEYYRRWLQRNHLKHDVAAVAEFAREHPFMFGQEIGVTTRGYFRWAERPGDDSPDAFSRYISFRYERWRAARVEARRAPIRRAIQPLRPGKLTARQRAARTRLGFGNRCAIYIPSSFARWWQISVRIRFGASVVTPAAAVRVDATTVKGRTRMDTE